MSKKVYRFGAAPVVVAMLATPALLASGCGDDGGVGGLDCGAEIVAKVEAFQGAIDGLLQVTGDIKASVAVACAGIATDLGGTPPDVGDGSNVSDDDIQMACAAAKASIDAEVNAGASIFVSITGGKCEANVQASFDCEAQCDIEGKCTPPSVEVRCEPGQLSGSCSGECTGSCDATGGSVDCAGECSATCMGMCSGECSSGMANNCMGKCNGTCMGQCTGHCEVVAPMASCMGSCKGSCDVAFTAPKCEGEVTPAECDIDADCKAGCQAQASVEASCTPPMITVEVQGMANAMLATSLEAHLGDLILVGQVQGELFGQAILNVFESAPAVVEAAVSGVGCAARFGADLVGNAAASATASVSVSVSVSASASASGSATGG
jgi:hypothetical protein